jgi:hypothetical protein
LTASLRRNAELTALLEGDHAIGPMPPLPEATPATDLNEARKVLAEKERAEAEAAQRRRQEEASGELERLHAQAEADREASIKAKLSNLGFKLITPIDLDLDWRKLAGNKDKIALRGTYLSNDGVEALSVQDKVNPLLRLYTDDASRDARKLLLECQEGDNTCPVIIGAEVSICTKNEGKIDETEVPCLKVLSAFEDN